MWKFLRGLSVVVMLYWSGGVAALPFTYDFGFVGEVNGFSGAGYFTITESTGAPTGLFEFEYDGLCGGNVCSFDINEVSFRRWDVDAGGVIWRLEITASENGPSNEIVYALEVDNAFLGSYCSDISAGRTCGDDQAERRVTSYGSSNAYLRLRDAPDPPPNQVPLPPTLFLVGVGSAGLHIFRRKRALHTQTAHACACPS